MQLSRLTQGLTLEDHIGQDVEITSLTCDTRTSPPGGLFAAFRGETDGNQWIPRRWPKGRWRFSCDHPPAEPGPWLVSPTPGPPLGRWRPTGSVALGDRMTLVGVTGTNGKTTTTYLLKKPCWKRCWGPRWASSAPTKTSLAPSPFRPSAPRRMPTRPQPAGRDGGGRLHPCGDGSLFPRTGLGADGGTHLSGGIFTNLTRDHLDFHGTMGAYRQAKAKLFAQCLSVGCLTRTTPRAKQFAQGYPARWLPSASIPP